MNMSLYQVMSDKYHYYIFTFTSLFSLLLLLTVVPLVSDQSLVASETLENESTVADNITLSADSQPPSVEDLGADSFPKIHTHMSGEEGIFVNGYLIETANGVVAIDSALTVSESKELKAQLDSINKPLLAVLLTHPHPDHVAGITHLVPTSTPSADIPIISLESIEGIMNATEEAKRAQWAPIFKEEWVSKWTYPNLNVKDKETVTFDGLTYRVHDFGPGGDSDANSIWIIENGPRVAFVGDLIFNGHHPYIADGHIQDWLKNLDKARGLLANITTIYPGHGQPGSLDLLDSQGRYLLEYIDSVKDLSGGNSTLTDEAKIELTERMEEFFPDAGLSFLIAQSADPVAAELNNMMTSKTNNTNNIVLVHGAFSDGYLWSKIIPILNNAGPRVIAAQLPLHSLADDVATLERVIEQLGGPTILGIRLLH